MSTRGLFTFVDPDDQYHVYKHSDCYPTGAFRAIKLALGFAWKLPRYEPDEFAAAFIAANKAYQLEDTYESIFAKIEAGEIPEPSDFGTVDVVLPVHNPTSFQHMGGGVRLLHSGGWQDLAPSDIAYRYEVTARRGKLWVSCYKVSSGPDWSNPQWTETRLYQGLLEPAIAWAEAEEAREKAEAAKAAE